MNNYTTTKQSMRLRWRRERSSKGSLIHVLDHDGRSARLWTGGDGLHRITLRHAGDPVDDRSMDDTIVQRCLDVRKEWAADLLLGARAL